MGAVAGACAGPGPEASARRERDLVRQGAATLSGAPVVDLHAHPATRLCSRLRGVHDIVLAVDVPTVTCSSGMTCASKETKRFT